MKFLTVLQSVTVIVRIIIKIKPLKFTRAIT